MSFDKKDFESTQGRATAAICLIALAGQIAQGMHDPASLLEHRRAGDRDVVKSELTSLGLSHEETVSMAKKLEDRAEKILDVYWDKVERVAAALIEQGVLTGEQFSQLMEEEPTMLTPAW